MIQSLKKTAQALESIISKQINQRVTSVVRPQTIQREGNLIGRKEAVSLYSELVAHGLVTPSFVVIEQRKPDNHQLKIKDNYDFLLLSAFVQSKKFMVEEDKLKSVFFVFKP